MSVSNQQSSPPQPSGHRWSHRLAWMLVSLAFLFTLMDGLITTLGDSRLMDNVRWIGAAGVLASIVLAGAVGWLDRRKSIRWLAFGVVGALVLIGTFGWLRVVFNEPRLAALFGYTAPLLCALCAAMVTVTSRAWRAGDQRRPAGRSTQWLALIVAVGVYLLILSGAQLRHPSPDSAPGWFTFWLWLQVILSGVVGMVVLLLWIQVVRRLRDCPMLVHRASLLAGLFLLQVLLGIGTWVTNYGVPGWFRDHVQAIDYTIAATGPLQVWTTTTHVATGSLVLIASVSFLLWSHRLLDRVGSA